MTSPDSRYVELDGLRGIAASAVVLYHLFHLFDVYFDTGAERPVVEFAQGYYGVQLFFLISGFVILLTARRSPRPSDFVIARATRLYPAYWVCLTISWLVVLALGVEGLRRTPLEIVVNYSMLQQVVGVRLVDGAYWSLTIELIFYALVTLVLLGGRPFDDRTVRRLALGWITVALLVCALDRLAPDLPFLDRITLVTAAEFAGLFATGMLLLDCRERGRITLWIGVTTGATFLCTLALRGLVPALVVLAISLAFSAVVVRPRVGLLRLRPLVFLGEISYPLYLVHQNVGYAVLVQLVPHVDRTLASVLAVVLVVLVAWVVHVTVEQTAGPRLRRLTLRLRDRLAPAAAVSPRPL